MKMYFSKTSERTPRAISTFPTTETRETYRMAEEISAILNEKPNKFFTVERIIKIGHKRGWCRPFTDNERISHTHPYGRILTDMNNPSSPLFCKNLEVADWMEGAHQFRIRTDVYRTTNGSWRKIKGVALLDYIPK